MRKQPLHSSQLWMFSSDYSNYKEILCYLKAEDFLRTVVGWRIGPHSLFLRLKASCRAFVKAAVGSESTSHPRSPVWLSIPWWSLEMLKNGNACLRVCEVVGAVVVVVGLTGADVGDSFGEPFPLHEKYGSHVEHHTHTHTRTLAFMPWLHFSATLPLFSSFHRWCAHYGRVFFFCECCACLLSVEYFSTLCEECVCGQYFLMVLGPFVPSSCVLRLFTFIMGTLECLYIHSLRS